MIEVDRKHWVDLLRGVCMIAILLDHTEVYYAGANIINYNFYVVNALTIFFFLSGYLMYGKWKFSLRHKVVSVFRGLILPYFIFTVIMALPKALAHGQSVSLSVAVLQIITGQASWFVAALAVAELIFSLIIRVFKKIEWAIYALSVIGFMLSILLFKESEPYFWQINNALQALLFLGFGYLFHQNESRVDKFIKTIYLPFVLILIIFLKMYERVKGIDMIVWYVHITSYPVFIVDSLLCALFMVMLCKRLRRNKIIEWTGRHSIVYYFLCGGVPLLIGRFMTKIGLIYDGNYYKVLVAFIIVYGVTTFLTYLIYRYIPFITGRKY